MPNSSRWSAKNELSGIFGGSCFLPGVFFVVIWFVIFDVVLFYFALFFTLLLLKYYGFCFCLCVCVYMSLLLFHFFLFVLYIMLCFFFKCIFFKRKRKKAWSWMCGKVVRIWGRRGKANHDQNVLFSKLLSIKIRAGDTKGNYD